MKSIYLIFALFISIQLNAQFPENFEFLDHSKQVSRPGVVLNLEDSLIYISHNEDRPNMTELLLARKDNTLDTLFSSPFSGVSKTVSNKDGSIDIFVTSLFDLDVGLPGFYAFHYNKDMIEIDTSYGNWQSSLYWNDPLDFGYISDIVRDSSSLFWILNHQGVFRVNGDTLDIFLDRSNFSGASQQLFKNQKDDIFLSTSSSIYHISQMGASVIIDYEDPAWDKYSDQNGNYLLYRDSLVLYTENFESKIQSWSFENELLRPKFIDSDNDQICIFSALANTYSILCPNEFDTFEIIYSDSIENEYPVSILGIDDNSFLLSGHYGFESIFINSFFRRVHFDHSTNYKNLQLDLVDFNLHRTGIDSSFRYVSNEGDSVFLFDYYYDYNIIYSNNSDTLLSFADIYSRDFYDFYDIGGPHISHRTVNLAIGQIDSTSGSFIVPHFDIMSNNSDYYLKIAAPGVNNRFNDSPMSAIVADYTSSIHDPDLPIKTMHIFPNPASDFIAIDPEITVSQYLIYDMNGILVQGGTMNSNQIDLSTRASGVYILKASDRSGKEVYLSRFIKH